MTKPSGAATASGLPQFGTDRWVTVARVRETQLNRVVRAHHVSSVLLLGLLLVLPIVVVSIPLGSAGGRGTVIPTLLSWTVLVYCAVRIGLFCWRGRARWADALFWAFSYVWLGLAGVAQVAAGRNPLHTDLSASAQTLQFIMILVGFLFFQVGYQVASRRSASHIPPRPTLSTRGISKARVLMLGLLTFALTPWFVKNLGGVTTLFSNRQAINDQLAANGLYSQSTNATGGSLVTIANVLPFACLMAVICLWRSSPELRRDAALWATFLALVAINVVLNNPLSNPRFWALAVLLSLTLCLRVLERPHARVALIGAFVLGAVLLFPYLDATRNGSFGSSAASQSSHRPVDFLLDKTDYGAVTDVGITVRFVEHNGHTWGDQLLGAGLFWYPRNLWPGKPPNTAELLAAEANFPNRNLDTPLWAEGYIDFGLLGTAGVLLVFGLVARRADAAIERAGLFYRYYATAGFTSAAAFIGYESFLLRGSLLQAMAKITFLCVVLAGLSTRAPMTTGAPSNDLAPPEEGDT